MKGVISIPDITYTGELQNLNQLFRNSLDIYANVIHVKSLPGVKSKHKNVDFVVIREQTEGEYTALEHESIKGKLRHRDLHTWRSLFGENFEIRN